MEHDRPRWRFRLSTMMLLTPEELAPDEAAYISIERRTP
jgi:hypothetical protein